LANLNTKIEALSQFAVQGASPSTMRNLGQIKKDAGFEIAQPEAIKMENAVDFKVADEVRRARESALRDGKSLGKAIIVTGDGDLSHAARALVNDGVAVQVWGGRKNMNRSYGD
jgi:hypothetical protein